MKQLLKLAINKNGFSLVETLVALGISSIILIASASILLSSFRATNQTSNQANIDNLHLNGVQKINNANVLNKIAMGSPAFKKCFERAGVNCSSFDGQVISSDPPEQFTLNGEACASGANCSVQRTTTMTSYCPNTTDNKSCERIVAVVSTDLLNASDNSKIRNHRTELTISSRNLKQRGLIDFKCQDPSITFLSGIDYQKLKATCRELPSINIKCDRTTPLKLIGDALPDGAGCTEVINANCAYGFSELGALSGQSKCSVIVSSSTRPLPPPPPPTVLPPPPDVTPLPDGTPPPDASPTPVVPPNVSPTPEKTCEIVQVSYEQFGLVVTERLSTNYTFTPSNPANSRFYVLSRAFDELWGWFRAGFCSPGMSNSEMDSALAALPNGLWGHKRVYDYDFGAVDTGASQGSSAASDLFYYTCAFQSGYIGKTLDRLSVTGYIQNNGNVQMTCTWTPSGGSR